MHTPEQKNILCSKKFNLVKVRAKASTGTVAAKKNI